MLDAVANKHEVEVSDSLHRVSYHATRAGTVGKEVEFIFLVAVYGICESVFKPVYQIEAVFFRQWGDFSDNLVHGVEKDVSYRMSVFSFFMSVC